jgi:ribosomal subunit interface protein
MEIIISSRHAHVAAAVESAVHDKIGRLERFDHDVRRARVHFTHEATARAADRESCEVILEANGERFVSRVAGPDQFAAVDQAVAKLEHQLSRNRARRLGRSRAV